MPPKYSKYTLWHNILAVTLANSPERRAKLSHSIFFLYIWHRTRHKHFEQKNGRCSCRGTMYTYASCCGYGSFRGDPYLWISLVDHVRFGTDRGLLWTTCWLQPMIKAISLEPQQYTSHYVILCLDQHILNLRQATEEWWRFVWRGCGRAAPLSLLWQRRHHFSTGAIAGPEQCNSCLVWLLRAFRSHDRPL